MFSVIIVPVWSGHSRLGEGPVTALHQRETANVGLINPSASYAHARIDKGPSLGHSGLPPSPSAIYKKREKALVYSVPYQVKG